MPLPKTLIIGVNSPIGLCVMRELGEQGVPLVTMGGSATSLGRYSRHATDYHIRPKGPIADWLADFVSRNEIRVVMAISETDLIQLARLKGRLPDCQLLVPDADKLEIVLDKSETLAIAARIGVDVPQSWQPEPGQDFAAIAGTLNYPLAVKWSDPPAVAAQLEQHGLALEKVEYAQTPADLLAILQRTDVLQQWPLAQQWCAGYGFGQMLHMHNGRASLVFQHQRLREWPPSGGVSCYCRSVDPALHREQMDKSEQLLASIGWQGPAMVEYRHDPDTGKYWLMEINGRFWGSIPLARHCGARFAWESYRTQILQETGPASAILHQRKARYMIPELKHLAAQMLNRTEKPLPLADKISLLLHFIAAFFDLRVRYYVWSWRDPGPLFGDLLAVFRKAVRSGKSGKDAQAHR